MRIKGYPMSPEAALLNDVDDDNDNNPNIIRKTHSAVEKNLIEETLIRCNYNRTLTAEALNVSRKTLFNKMKKYGLN
jgi:DNA-binding NtrC family response regulator